MSANDARRFTPDEIADARAKIAASRPASDEPRASVPAHRPGPEWVGKCELCTALASDKTRDLTEQEASIATQQMIEVTRVLTKANLPIVLAVLAEVARQDAAGYLNGDACSRYDYQIANAAFAIREAMRLNAGGAT